MKTIVSTFAMILLMASSSLAADPLSGDYTGVPAVPATGEGAAAPVATTPVVTAPVEAAPVVTAPVTTAPVATAPVDDIKKDRTKKERKANFGALVSAEAHRLKAAGLNGSTKMGGWVSNQRRQSASKTEAVAKVTGGAEKTVGHGRKK